MLRQLKQCIQFVTSLVCTHNIIVHYSKINVIFVVILQPLTKTETSNMSVDVVDIAPAVGIGILVLMVAITTVIVIGVVVRYGCELSCMCLHSFSIELISLNSQKTTEEENTICCNPSSVQT